MKIDKKIKAAYEALPTPKAEDVLPAAAFREEKRERHLFRPVIYAVATICLCAVIGVIYVLNRPSDEPKVIIEPDVKTEYQGTIEQDMWLDIVCVNYAIVKVGELAFEETYDEYVEQLETTVEVKYRIYDFEMIYLYTGYSFTLDEKSEFILFENYNDFNVKKGDILFICCYSTHQWGYECLSVDTDESGNSSFIKVENGCAEFNDDVLKKLNFRPIADLNKIIDWRSNHGYTDANDLTTDQSDKKPSLPKKKMYGTVTVEEIIEYFDSVRKAYDYWLTKRKALTNVI